MDIAHWLILLGVAALCGSIAQALVGYSHGGCIVATALGFIGALLGVWISNALGLPEIFNLELGGVSFPVVWSIIGASLFVAVLSLLGGRRRVE